jgi:hypothetical protein
LDKQQINYDKGTSKQLLKNTGKKSVNKERLKSEKEEPTYFYFKIELSRFLT